MELRREFEAARHRARDDTRRDLIHAWHVAAFASAAQAGKLKPLNEVLAPYADTMTHRLQSPAEQRDALRTIAARAGIPIREFR